jgi:site-specific DNA-methyltransferase (adenine-specific)
MKPYYQDDAVTIYHGDCHEIMPCVDLAGMLVTDPPYGIGWKRGPWDDDVNAYPELMRWLVEESRHSVSGWCFVFQAMPNCGRFHEWFPEGWRIFAACKNFAQIRPTGVWHSWDPVVFWNNGPNSKPNSKPNSGTLNRDYHIGNVAGALGDRIEHPCPRPQDTTRHIVALGDGLVVDPFAGSGTTLRAAKDLGRKAIGIEIEERYCEIAAKRCAQETLFRPPPMDLPPDQIGIFPES